MRELECNIYRLSTWSIATLAASAAFSPAANAKLDDSVLPDGAVSVCQKHIPGAREADGTPGAHIVTHQYGSALELDTILRFYEARFGRAPEHEKNGGYIWIHGGWRSLEVRYSFDCCGTILVRLQHPATRRADRDFSFHDDVAENPRRDYRPLSRGRCRPCGAA